MRFKIHGISFPIESSLRGGARFLGVAASRLQPLYKRATTGYEATQKKIHPIYLTYVTAHKYR